MRTKRYFDDQTKVSRRWWILLSVVVVLLLAAIIFIPIYYTLLKRDNRLRHVSIVGPHGVIVNKWSPQCGDVEERFDCYPDSPAVSRDQCKSRGCCWKDEARGVKCFYPSNYGYVATDKNTNFYNGFEMDLMRLAAPLRYGDDLSTITIRVEMQTPCRLRIKIYDSQNPRYEVEEPTIPDDIKYYSNPNIRLYSVTYNKESVPFGIKVRRIATDTIIFDTTGPGLIFSDQFLEMTIKLPSPNLYGLSGQSLRTFRNSPKRIIWNMFASQDSSSVHPVYMCIEKDGNSHGVLLLNSNAMEIELHPAPAITFRTIGGILDFYVFLGPTPEDVVQQYTEAIGYPMMPPYWSLGFQMGRNGYLSIDHIKWVLDKIKDKNIPQDVQSISSDYATNGCMFTLNRDFESLSKLSSDLQEEGMKLILEIHPSICVKKTPVNNPYKRGVDMGIFVNNSWNIRPIVGKVGKSDVVFPDFSNPITLKWWTENLQYFYSKLKFDGVWIEDNEPYNSVNGSTNGCLNDIFNSASYIPKISTEKLYDKTLCMNAIHRGKERQHLHYDVHNVYGHNMGVATYQAFSSINKGNRPLVLSHSTFAGSGKYVGYWFRNNRGLWTEMSSSIPSILHYSLFGIPYTGAAICGFDGDPEEELCLRWLQLGAFYPLSRHHKAAGSKMWITKCNSNGEQSNFKRDFVRVTQKVLEKRYELLPYLYTLFHHAHVKGSTVARPLWHQFYKDNITYNIEEQFLWGPALLISPVLKKGATSVKAYFPKGLWYDYYTGEKFQSNGQWETLSATLYNTAQPINLHIFGGNIITTQKSAINTKLSRQNPFKLLVALNASKMAEGYLYWDDDSKDSFRKKEYVYVKYTASNDKLVIKGYLGKKIFKSNFHQIHIKQVRIMGLPWQPDYITLDGNYLLRKKQYKWNDFFKILDLQNILISLTQTAIIHWFD